MAVGRHGHFRAVGVSSFGVVGRGAPLIRAVRLKTRQDDQAAERSVAQLRVWITIVKRLRVIVLIPSETKLIGRTIYHRTYRPLRHRLCLR